MGNLANGLLIQIMEKYFGKLRGICINETDLITCLIYCILEYVAILTFNVLYMFTINSNPVNGSGAFIAGSKINFMSVWMPAYLFYPAIKGLR